MTVLISICAIILFFVLVVAAALSANLKMIIRTDADGKTKILFKILFFKYESDGNITGKYGKNKKKPKTKEEKSFKKKISEFGLSGALGSVLKTLTSLIKEFFWLVGKCRVKRFDLKIICTGGDAASAVMEYGTVCALLYPFLGFVFSNVKCDEKNLDIKIFCDYEKQNSELSVNADVSIRLYYVAAAVLRILKKIVKIKLSREKRNEIRHSEQPTA